ncbi:hypothetical protein [Acidithiobacillus sp.]|uniref:hypothetical protein n=1 Tax=Acidithiobacillus sp. TaxID=1872118 RepID=UPI003D0352EC
MDTVKEVKFNGLKAAVAKHAALAVGLTLLGTAVALASTGGPFGAMTNFLKTDLMPGIAGVGVLGGIGYAAIHGFKHDYGKMAVGGGVAVGGGLVASNSSWFVSSSGVSSATLGAHVPLIVTALHALGL